MDSFNFEKKFVHHFYDSKSSEFSATRRKHWPITKYFLEKYPSPLVFDSGCGNGRSIIHKNIVGLDYSMGLLKYAKEKENSGLVRGDILHLPFKDGVFSSILSVAVIHHLSTPERRKEAMEEMRRILKPGGKILLYVWNEREKKEEKFKNITSGSKDYLVSWRGEVERYYYLYSLEELVEFSEENKFRVVESGVEQESCYVILEKTASPPVRVD